MPNIVAGRFDEQQQASDAMRALAQAGFAPQDVTTFALNDPGQHARYPIGGDELADPTSAGGEKGAAAGAGIGSGVGLVVGIAATPLVGPIGIAAGAGTGALLGAIGGALNRISDNAEERGDEPERRAGVMVAVHAPEPGGQERALRTLVDHGAREIETADGTWRNGQWVDFDPVAAPATTDQVHPASGRGSR